MSGSRLTTLEDEVVRLREQLRAEQARADRLDRRVADLDRIARGTAARYGLTADASWDHEPAYWIGRLGAHIADLDQALRDTQADAERLRVEGEAKDHELRRHRADKMAADDAWVQRNCEDRRKRAEQAEVDYWRAKR